MNNLVGISIGTIHLKGETIESRIQLVKEINKEALEISFFKDSEAKQKISPDSKNYLNKLLKYVSIHAPMFEGNMFIPYFNFNMKELKRWYFDEANSKAVVFHPHQNIPPAEPGMVFCVENMPPIPGKDFDLVKKLAEYKLREHLEYKLILDACHALHYPGYLEEVVEKYHDRIQHVHLSDRRYNPEKKKTRDHQTFAECQDKDKFSPLRGLSCPIIAEISLRYQTPEECREILKREIDSVKTFFS